MEIPDNIVERLNNLDYETVQVINNYYINDSQIIQEKKETKNYFIGDGTII